MKEDLNKKEEELYELAVDAAIRAFKTKKVEGDITRLAIQTISNKTRQDATKVHAKTLDFAMAKTVYKDEATMTRYIKSTAPHLLEVKALKQAS